MLATPHAAGLRRSGEAHLLPRGHDRVTMRSPRSGVSRHARLEVRMIYRRRGRVAPDDDAIGHDDSPKMGRGPQRDWLPPTLPTLEPVCTEKIFCIFALHTSPQGKCLGMILCYLLFVVVSTFFKVETNLLKELSSRYAF